MITLNDMANIYQKCLIIIFRSFVGSFYLLNPRGNLAENVIRRFDTHSSITTTIDDFKINVKFAFKLGIFKDIRNVIVKL